MAHTPETRARALAITKQRRLDWLAANGPCRRCQSWDNLEVDHVEPGVKMAHSIWSWSQIRRERELAKCQPLCRTCHKIKSAEHSRKLYLGRTHPELRKLSDRQLLRAKEMRDDGTTVREIARKLQVCHATIVRLTNALKSNGGVPSSRGEQIKGKAA